MIGHFPDPWPDEVLYSVCARYSDHVRYSNNEYIFRELFGDKSVGAVIDLPCHLEYLINNLPHEHEYTVDFLIAQHTLLPFYSPFLPLEQLSIIREQMIKGNGRGIHRRTGITGFSVPRPLWLRYCPVCIKTDRAEVGEAYWHRLHQAPGVEICPVHATFLENSTVRVQIAFTSKAFFSAEQALKTIALPRTAVGSPFYQIFMKLALDISYLLNHSIVSPGSHFFREQYFSLLANHGLTAGGLIRSTHLLQAFMDYYPQELLTLLHCEIHQIQKITNNWLARLATVDRTSKYSQHPLHHLLLLHLLDSTVETFFLERTDYPKPFGNGPWPCLNPVCEHYRELHILSCQIKRNEKNRPSGRFTCDCGFSYCRIGPDHSPEDVSRRDKILSYGFLWETKLRELWLEPTVSLNEISRRLGVSNGTLYRQAARLELPVPRYSPYPIRMDKPVKRRTKDISWYRDQWLALLDEMPEAGISVLRRKLPSVYSWLKHHDQEWLLTHRPSSKLSNEPQPQMQQPLGHLKKSLPKHSDKINRDAQTAEAIRATAYQLINNPGPPERISLRRISKYVPQAIYLKHHSDKAPLTARALQDVIETREAFALRRIWRWVECYRRENILPTRSQLIDQANVGPIAGNPQVKQAIDAALEALSRPIYINDI